MELNKENIINFIKSKYDLVILIVLLVGCIVLWQRGQSYKQELEITKNTQAINKTINDIDAKLDDMKQREKELYPQLEQQLSDLEKTRSSFVEAEKKLKLKNRKDITNEIQKLNVDQVSQYFTTNGYNNRVSSGN